MKKHSFLLIPVLAFLCSFGPASKVVEFKYQVLLDGKPIGTYAVNRTEWNGTANFKVETNTAAGLIRRDEHRSVMMSSYKNSKLVSSELKTWVNEKIEKCTVLNWDGNQYVKHDGEEMTEIHHELVSYSSACIYFQEPIGHTSLFYEQFGQELELRSIGSHRYEVTLPNGSIERFTYKNGKAVQVDMVQSFTTISLKLAS